MQVTRRVLAADPRSFGRGPLRELEPAVAQAGVIHPDVKLFLTTFVAGFLFVSVLIG
jgi:hypothetical protein